MSALRQRLTDEFTGHSGVLDTEGVVSDALEVFAAWLRKEAGNNCYFEEVGGGCIAGLADEIGEAKS